MDKPVKNHWDRVYETKNPDQVSWTEKVPKTSLDFIYSFGLSRTAKIIDIGGGDSSLVDFLLEDGFENITVLDISAKALEKSKGRLGEKARKINWIVSDITEFQPDTTYELWHDRATFHFLIADEEIKKYVQLCENNITAGGHLILGTFSEKGPKKCSGLEISQYSENTLSARFRKGFEKITCKEENHLTPQNSIQHFLFCSFKKQENI
jgi:2-polyprenyl-3-methyl-5-hydroxy-6-metoxy-1,4-benzoquinol methylase